MLVGFDLGAKLVTLPRFETDTFLNTIHLQHVRWAMKARPKPGPGSAKKWRVVSSFVFHVGLQPTVLHLVPPLVSFLGHNKDWKKDAFHRLHTICCGAAPLGAAAATKLMDRLNLDGCVLQEGFGMTESSPVSHMGPIKNYKIGSCGEVVSRTLAKIIDINTGEALGPNQEGELCVTGPQIMKGYYNNEKATSETIDSDGWLHTGDIAIYDEDNQFFIVDRLKELIKVKGLQVTTRIRLLLPDTLTRFNITFHILKGRFEHSISNPILIPTTWIQFEQLESNSNSLDPIRTAWIQFEQLGSNSNNLNLVRTTWIQFEQLESNPNSLNLIPTTWILFKQLESSSDNLNLIQTAWIQSPQLLHPILIATNVEQGSHLIIELKHGSS